MKMRNRKEYKADAAERGAGPVSKKRRMDIVRTLLIAILLLALPSKIFAQWGFDVASVEAYINDHKKQRSLLLARSTLEYSNKLLHGYSKDETKAYTPGTDYAQILEGYHYRYYLSKSAETAWCNIPSGEYEAGFKAKLTAVSQNSNAKLVYTTDGTDPTAKSKQVTNGNTINIDNTCTLKVGLLNNGTVTGIRTYNYTIKAFEPYTITVYANAEQVTNWGSVMYFYAWNTSGEFTEKWPGTAVTATKTLNGKKWYYMNFKIKSKDAIVNIIFNQGNGTGKKQTVDLNAGNSTKYYEITTAQSEGKYTCKDVTAIWGPTGITGTPTINNTTTDNAWYTLSGMKLSKKPAESGVYIHQGKKVIIR